MDVELRRAVAAQKLFSPETTLLKMLEVRRPRKRSGRGEAQYLLISCEKRKRSSQARMHRLTRSGKGLFDVSASYKLEDIALVEDTDPDGVAFAVLVGKSTTLAFDAPSVEQKWEFVQALFSACDDYLVEANRPKLRGFRKDVEGRATAAIPLQFRPPLAASGRPGAEEVSAANGALLTGGEEMLLLAVLARSGIALAQPDALARSLARLSTKADAANTRSLLRAEAVGERLADDFAIAAAAADAAGDWWARHVGAVTAVRGAVEALEARHLRLGAIHRNAACAADAVGAALDAARVPDGTATLLREGDLQADAEAIAAAARELMQSADTRDSPIIVRTALARERENEGTALMQTLAERFCMRARRVFADKVERAAAAYRDSERAKALSIPHRLREHAAVHSALLPMAPVAGVVRAVEGRRAARLLDDYAASMKRLYGPETALLFRELRHAVKDAPPAKEALLGDPGGSTRRGGDAVEQAAGAAVGALAGALCAEERFMAAFFFAQAECPTERPVAGQSDAVDGAGLGEPEEGALRAAMETAFDGALAALQAAVDTACATSPSAAVRIVAEAGRARDAHGSRPASYARRLLSDAIERATLSLMRFAEEQAAALAAHKVGVGKRGIIEPVARLPALAEALEGAARGGGPAARAALEAAWAALGSGVCAAVERAAAADTKHADAVRLENYGALAARLAPLVAEAGGAQSELGKLVERVQALCEEARGRYVNMLLAEALPEFSAFASAAEAALASGAVASPAELQYQAATSKAALRRVRDALHTYEKGVESAAKRASRHLSSGAGGSLPSVWEVMSSTLETRYRRFEQLVVQCYGVSERPPEPPDTAALRSACARAYARLSI